MDAAEGDEFKLPFIEGSSFIRVRQILFLHFAHDVPPFPGTSHLALPPRAISGRRQSHCSHHQFLFVLLPASSMAFVFSTSSGLITWGFAPPFISSAEGTRMMSLVRGVLGPAGASSLFNSSTSQMRVEPA